MTPQTLPDRLLAEANLAVVPPRTAEILREAAAALSAPVDVRVALPKVTFKNAQRGDCGKYPDGTGWGHAWSAPIVEIERADWDRFIALLSGQPAGVCVYPDCNCPFDAPADPNWCARGLPKAARPQVELAELPVAFDRLPCEPDDDMIDVFTPTQMHAYAQQAIAESEARAEGLRKLLAEMIELRQATQDGRVTDRHELDIVRDAKAAIAQEAEREAASAATRC